jgi:plastocyanin
MNMNLWRTKRTLVAWAIRSVGAVFALAISLTLAGRAVGSASTPATAQQENAAAKEVNIDNFTFVPKELTIPAGTQVTWTNKDDDVHTVVSVDGKTFKSKGLDTGDKFSFTFKDPGKYEYLCSIHAQMKGTIIVK